MNCTLCYCPFSRQSSGSQVEFILHARQGDLPRSSSYLTLILIPPTHQCYDVCMFSLSSFYNSMSLSSVLQSLSYPLLLSRIIVYSKIVGGSGIRIRLIDVKENRSQGNKWENCNGCASQHKFATPDLHVMLDLHRGECSGAKYPDAHSSLIMESSGIVTVVQDVGEAALAILYSVFVTLLQQRY